MAHSLKTALAAAGVAAVLAGPARPAAAQFRDSVTVVPGARYGKGGVYRFFFGSHYRDLWTTPVRVPVLDLAHYAGGLTPTRRGGGQQTKSLRLAGADGREYQFRSVDKDPSAALPPDLRETFADRIFQDQISSGHPAGTLVVPPLLAAAGVLHATPTMVLMPDDPALGEFRAEFGNLLGTIEERPRDADEEDISFAGALEVAGSDDVLKAVERDPGVPVDARAFLRARLLDVFLGDWDRHRDQWRWALVDDSGGRRWLPIPRDRDQAFVRFDGLLLDLVRKQVPQLVNFGPDYPPIEGATWNGRDLDRRLLSGLGRDVWREEAERLQASLTDPVIAAGVDRMPEGFRAVDGPRLTRALQARRDGLPAMAAEYYRHLAAQVDIHASDHPDEVRVERLDARYVEVAIGGPRPWYFRRFDRRETNDIRVYLHGGDDRAVVTGPGPAGITVRFIGGGGDDTLRNESPAGRAKFYDDRGRTTASGGPLDTRRYRAITDPDDPKALPHRDWGMRKLSFPVGSYGPDAGFQAGWGGRFTRYGFRKQPWSSRLGYTVVAATGAGNGRLHVNYRMMRENSRNFWAVDGLASGIEVLRWYGFGNATRVDGDRPMAYYRVTQHQIALAPSLGWALGRRSLLSFGPRFRYSVTGLDDGHNAERFIGLDRPFGAGHFSQLGFAAQLEVDTRDVPAAARRGVHLVVAAAAHPALFDVTHAYGSVSAEGATYLTARLPGTPTLALKAGGQRIWGTAGAIPYFDAAVLGSASTLRGYRTGRFAGDEGAVWGSAELRLHLTSLFIAVPGQQGVFGFYDGGRVFHRGDGPGADEWHHSVGGGLWLSFLTRGSLVSLAVGRSDEGNRFHARVGFAF